jgi:hypothetical protein
MKRILALLFLVGCSGNAIAVPYTMSVARDDAGDVQVDAGSPIAQDDASKPIDAEIDASKPIDAEIDAAPAATADASEAIDADTDPNNCAGQCKGICGKLPECNCGGCTIPGDVCGGDGNPQFPDTNTCSQQCVDTPAARAECLSIDVAWGDTNGAWPPDPQTPDAEHLVPVKHAYKGCARQSWIPLPVSEQGQCIVNGVVGAANAIWCCP